VSELRDDTAARPGAREAALARYIAGVGVHVREVRARCGMTRTDLARRSGISLRYLAQVESGRANVSITLLWQIASACGVPVEHLLPGARDLAVRVHRGVALVGLRGAGKTTLGRGLARAAAAPFVRLGEVVERLSGMQAPEIFSLGGPGAYRRYEAQALEHVIGSHDRVVLETGGSLVSEADTFARLRECFHTVWVRAAPAEHMQRVIAQGDLRPMEGIRDSMEDLHRILDQREPLYRSADQVLDTSARAVSECVEELVSTCAVHFGGRRDETDSPN
jgi:XRE family aerobic/anaerobic benzoate catabolism transcriptional regulator